MLKLQNYRKYSMWIFSYGLHWNGNIAILTKNRHWLVEFGIFTRGQFWPSDIVVACACLSVCVSACPSIQLVNHRFVRAIFCHPFKLNSPNLDHKCKTPCLRSHFEIVRMISHHRLKLGFPNLDQKASLHCWDSYWFWVWLTLTFIFNFETCFSTKLYVFYSFA